MYDLCIFRGSKVSVLTERSIVSQRTDPHGMEVDVEVGDLVKLIEDLSRLH